MEVTVDQVEEASVPVIPVRVLFPASRDPKDLKKEIDVTEVTVDQGEEVSVLVIPARVLFPASIDGR
ncbi:hypothetical protein ACF0H5_012816 [Mactra antiquata]